MLSLMVVAPWAVSAGRGGGGGLGGAAGSRVPAVLRLPLSLALLAEIVHDSPKQTRQERTRWRGNIPGQLAQQRSQGVRQHRAVLDALDSKHRRRSDVPMIGNDDVGGFADRPDEFRLRQAAGHTALVEDVDRRSLRRVRPDLVPPADDVARRSQASVADQNTQARQVQHLREPARQYRRNIDEDKPITTQKRFQKREKRRFLDGHHTFKGLQRCQQVQAGPNVDHSALEKQLVDTLRSLESFRQCSDSETR